MTPSYLTPKNILIAVVVIFVLVALVSFRNKGIALYETFKQAEIYKAENIKLKKEIESNKKVIDENAILIESIEKDRASLAKKIVTVRVKRETIKNPKDIEEITDRLRLLGLNPRVSK